MSEIGQQDSALTNANGGIGSIPAAGTAVGKYVLSVAVTAGVITATMRASGGQWNQ